MIAFLRGKLVANQLDSCLLDVNGVGYKVYIHARTAGALPEIGEEALLHTSLQVREEGWSLYGFTKAGERDLFELLQTVAGIGPKGALACLGVLGQDGLCLAVMEENVKALTSVPGIGPKTAKRMVLELKDRLKKLMGEDLALPANMELPTGREGEMEATADAILALEALGYQPQEARQAVAAVLTEEPGDLPIEEILKKALAYLATG
ncbi:Holliday junction DNA helicase subunit RuvA [Carboxydocella sporoproducens DSM 16521]|uniref:Holliday junction branch migration complex subunit RuvA n=2 Tax=Carboxydocella TaxID=178898 RepID=A0A1T4SLG6_9FIRM|nr:MULTISPECIES: Holliday junction branch migration protein RuvA [Carboxydocella]AVX21477.1 Holliday junction DNA helicase subunit RuvA [Carboxydocella thermautotrophica]AVX31965.1 Holliday junction DNA helicase subunit RuvA [Carboxydocella thermautotrophica]SKA29059.1 Holliday junction DNA helicase subunit RuvA [Carboxydocella sporoproducens DSM 16521]